MKKLIASVLTLVCILTLARCGKSDSGDYPATIMVNGTNYYSTDHAVPVEVDESVIQYTTFMQKTAYLKKMAKPISTEI